jgi:hypothetical protein
LLRLAVVDHRLERRDALSLVLVRRLALVDHHALRAEGHRVIDPHLGEIDREQPVALLRRRDVQAAEFQIDLRGAGLRLLQLGAQIPEIRRFDRREVIVLELHLVHAVGVGDHLADIEQLQRASRAVLRVGHFQDALEVERHDRDAIERRLPDLLPVDFRIDRLRGPSEPGGRERRDAGSGGGAEEFPSIHFALLA